jgi:hypothetical protein
MRLQTSVAKLSDAQFAKRKMEVIQEKKKLTSETAEIYELSDGRVAELSGDDRDTIVRGVDLKRRLALVRSPRPTGLHHRFRPAASRPHL